MQKKLSIILSSLLLVNALEIQASEYNQSRNNCDNLSDDRGEETTPFPHSVGNHEHKDDIDKEQLDNNKKKVYINTPLQASTNESNSIYEENPYLNDNNKQKGIDKKSILLSKLTKSITSSGDGGISTTMLEQLNHQLNNVTEENKKLKEEKHKIAEEIKKLTQAQKETVEKNVKLLHKVQDLQKKLEDNTIKDKESNDQYNALQIAYNKLIQKHQELQTDCKQLIENYNELKKLIDDGTVHATFSNTTKTIAKNLDNIIKQIDIKELVAKEDHSYLEKRLAQILDKQKTSNERQDTLFKHILESQSIAQNLELNKNEIVKQLTNEINDGKNKLYKLQQEYYAVKNKLDIVTNTNKELQTKLQKKDNESNDTLSDFQQQYELVEQRLEKVQKENEELRDQIKIWQAKYNDIKNANDSLLKTNKNQLFEIQKYQKKQKELESLVNKLQQEKESLVQSNKQYKDQYQQYQQKQTELESSANKLKQENKYLSQRKDFYKVQYQQSTNEYAKLKKNINDLLTKKKELETKIQDCENKIDTRTKQYQQLKQYSDFLMGELDILQPRIDDTQIQQYLQKLRNTYKSNVNNNSQWFDNKKNNNININDYNVHKSNNIMNFNKSNNNLQLNNSLIDKDNNKQNYNVKTWESVVQTYFNANLPDNIRNIPELLMSVTTLLNPQNDYWRDIMIIDDIYKKIHSDINIATVLANYRLDINTLNKATNGFFTGGGNNFLSWLKFMVELLTKSFSDIYK